MRPASQMLPPLYAQDPQLEVRAAFGAKVRRTVSVLLAGAPQRAAKYAALLPLAAADPCAEHRHAAYQARLHLFTCIGRLVRSRCSGCRPCASA